MTNITDQVVDFYNSLFLSVFFDPFEKRIADRRRREAVRRQVSEAADAASQSLERFFANQQLSAAEVARILGALEFLTGALSLSEVANPYVAAENIVERLIQEPSCACGLPAVKDAGKEAVYRLAFHSVVQSLMQIGPVMAEWQNIGFPSTFELPRRVITRLNEISGLLDVLGKAGSEAADERYELQYRDHLSQKFYRVEAGTVKMTTNQPVDLRELFVMPNVRERKPKKGVSADAPAELMSLAQARFLAKAPGSAPDDGATLPALDQLKRQPRNVIVGAPGSGKSTFLEWLQLKLASAEEVFPLGGQQAIPILLRVRQLDADHLPAGSSIIERASESRDLATLMPAGWLDRQMASARVIFMLDGLDEVEPEVRDRRILPWFLDICKRYPQSHFVLSSRPVGYPDGLLRKLEFSESELLDFTGPQIAEYCRHWCTAIRLARNEPSEEARREGTADGDLIVSGFKGHSYIESLARNPLMLSAVCLVNYFEGGELPKDRAKLYQMCVEGLLHNWDQRRGIRSEFTFDEKLRACREVALQMQAADCAEFALERVRGVFSAILKNAERAAALLEHIRYRTGLLLERRAGVFAFAHLTFQEYLAARGVYEGNQIGIDAARLTREHRDARWQEVIALCCGIVPTPSARAMIEALMAMQMVPRSLLEESYFSAGLELAQDIEFRRRVMRALARTEGQEVQALRFQAEEFAPIANEVVGCANILGVSTAHSWLCASPTHINFDLLVSRLKNWVRMSPEDCADVSYLIHRFADSDALIEVAGLNGFYASEGPAGYRLQAILALEGLTMRLDRDDGGEASSGFDLAFGRAFECVAKSNLEHDERMTNILRFGAPPDLVRKYVRRLAQDALSKGDLELAHSLDHWYGRSERRPELHHAPHKRPRKKRHP